jgi:hypothetical protein
VAFISAAYSLFLVGVIGLSNQEIGARSFVSDKTVKVHLHKVFQKVGVRNRPHLAQVFTRREEESSPGSDPARPSRGTG